MNEIKQRPMSVTIFGILNIGFGLLDLLVTLFSLFILPRLSIANNPMLSQMHDNLWTKISTPLDGIASLALLAAGVGLLMLMNWARNLSFVYGIYGILVTLIGLVVTLCGDGSVMTKILSFFGAVVSLVYPILLLIFMTRPKVVEAFKPASVLA
jgi:hypothetical protein